MTYIHTKKSENIQCSSFLQTDVLYLYIRKQPWPLITMNKYKFFWWVTIRNSVTHVYATLKIGWYVTHWNSSDLLLLMSLFWFFNETVSRKSLICSLKKEIYQTNSPLDFPPKLNSWMLRAPHYWRSQFCELFRWICGLELNSFRERNGLAIFRKTELLIFLANLIGKIYGCITCYIEEVLYYKVSKVEIIIAASIGRVITGATWWMYRFFNAFFQVKEDLFLETILTICTKACGFIQFVNWIFLLIMLVDTIKLNYGR